MKILSFIFAAAVLAVSCEDRQSTIQVWPWEDAVVEEIELPVPATLDKWTDVSSDYGTLPEYIKVYKSPEKLEAKLAVAYIAVADMAAAQWDIWSISDVEMDGTDEAFKTPAAVYAEGSWPVVINAGFFYSSGGLNYSSSLAVRESEVLAYNINYASEDWVTLYYPTRAAFLESESGEFNACWTYKRSDAHYMYPSPSDNTWEAKPAKTPSSTYPEGAENAIKNVGSSFIMPRGDDQRVGMPGVEILVFTAQEVGTYNLKFDYKRPWERLGSDSFNFTVVVKE